MESSVNSIEEQEENDDSEIPELVDQTIHREFKVYKPFGSWLKKIAGFPSRNSHHRGVCCVMHDRIYCFYLLTDYLL